MPDLATTTAVQDYLKAIYQLGGSRADVPTSAVAGRLGVSPASVSGMLRKLHDAGLADHTPYQGVRLTRRGAREAVEMIRHHRLLELYLTEVVGMPLDKVHAEADALEHVISEDLESRLDELLGYPKVDPHGHPIPSAELELDEADDPTLAAVEPGRYTVAAIADRDADLLRFLDGLGLRPGRDLVVTEVVAYRGGVRVQVEGPEDVPGNITEHVIGLDAAEAVRVR